MRIDWTQAPDSAEWLAGDANGAWYWHVGQPKQALGAYWESGEGFYRADHLFPHQPTVNENWRNCLFKRPKTLKHVYGT